MWYRIDDSFDSGEQFGALKPVSASQEWGLFMSAADYLIGLSLLGIVGLLAWSFRKFWFGYVLLLGGILMHKFLLHSKIGWGYDGVEGSAMLYASLLVVLAALVYAVFLQPKSFLSLGLFGALYLAIDRITQINPGMRYDHFLPVTGKSFASNLSAVFFGPRRPIGRFMLRILVAHCFVVYFLETNRCFTFNLDIDILLRFFSICLAMAMFGSVLQ